MGRKVERVVVPDETILRNATPRTLDRALRGHVFEEPERVGKWMLGWTDGPGLLLHFGMTGFFVWSGDEPVRHRHDRVILELDGGDELRYRNMRKLGGAWLAHDRDEVADPRPARTRRPDDLARRAPRSARPAARRRQGGPHGPDVRGGRGQPHRR